MEQQHTNGQLAELDFDAKMALLDDSQTDDATLLEVITPEDRQIVRQRMKEADRRYLAAMKANIDLNSEVAENAMWIKESPKDVIGNWLGLVTDDERSDRKWARCEREGNETAKKVDQTLKELDEAAKESILWGNRFYRLPTQPGGGDNDIEDNPLNDLMVKGSTDSETSSTPLVKALKIGLGVGGALGLLSYLANR